MSRLSEILGVPEGREFKYEARGYHDTYKIEGNKRMYKSKTSGKWYECTNETSLCDIIAHSDLIHLIPEKSQLTDQQITAIKGRIAEGTPWAARDISGGLFFCENKPYLSKDQKYFWSLKCGFVSESNLYDFITYDNSPVYLPDLIEGA